MLYPFKRRISASGATLVRPHAGVAGKAGRELHDGAGVIDVVIAARQERRPRRRAERRGMEAVVAQSAARELLQGRHADGPAESARVPESDVVDQDDDHVRRALRRLHLEARGRRRLARVDLGDRDHGRLRDGKDRTVQRRGRARRCRRLSRPLRTRGQDDRKQNSRSTEPPTMEHQSSLETTEFSSNEDESADVAAPRQPFEGSFTGFGFQPSRGTKTLCPGWLS